jgi:hypothetical protein
MADQDKFVYRFSEGSKEMKDLLGGKGSGLGRGVMPDSFRRWSSFAPREKAGNPIREVRGMEREGKTDKPVLEEWLGYWVFITYMSGPNLDQNEPTKLVRGQPEAITASFFLEDYGPLGIEVARSTETPTIFLSWGAVMYIQGPPPEVRKQIDEEVSKRTEGGAGLN